MTNVSPPLALNLKYLLSCRIAFCRAAYATPCRTPPLSCRNTISLLALHLSCAGWLLHRLLSHYLSCTGWLLNCHLSPRIAASLYHALLRSLDVIVAAPPSSPPPACHCRHRGDNHSLSRRILLLLLATSASLMSTSSTTTSSNPPIITVSCPIVQSNPRWG
jgi:hypothetical protein